MNFSHKNGASNRLFLGVLALLVWAPLPLGSNRPWAWAIMEVGAFTLLAVWLTGHWSRPFRFNSSVTVARTPLALLLLWLAYTLFQAVPLPTEVVKTLSPASFAMYLNGTANEATGWAPISADIGLTLVEFFKASSYVAIFFLILVLVDSKNRLLKLISAIVFLGFVEAVYGLANTLTGVEYIWWSSKTAYKGFVTGTFINRNHFAGFMEIVIPLGLGLLMADQPKLSHYPNWKAMLRGIVTMLLESRGRLVVYTLIMFAALFLSASRGGVASLFIALFVTLSLSFIFRGFRGAEARFGIFILAMAIIASLWLGLGVLPERYKGSDTAAGARASIWKPTIKILIDYPYFGSGAGTFQYLFPSYRDGKVLGYYDHAHNDYLEQLSEQGVFGFILLGGAIILLEIQILRGYIKRSDPLLRGMLFASLTGTLSLLLHAIVDFNFHIPANAGYFFALLGIGVVASTIKSESRVSGNARGNS